MNIVLAGILVSEIGFWVLLLAGLLTRYLLRMPRVSAALLLGVLVLDVILLVLLGWDMIAAGAKATFIHGLAAVYLGFTLAFGRSIIRGVDKWFAHRFAGGPPPRKIPKYGRERVKHEWREWSKMLLCAAISAAVLGAIVVIVDDPVRTEELHVWFLRLGLVTGVWLVGWPVWASVEYLLKGEPTSQAGTHHE